MPSVSTSGAGAGGTERVFEPSRINQAVDAVTSSFCQGEEFIRDVISQVLLLGL